MNNLIFFFVFCYGSFLAAQETEVRIRVYERSCGSGVEGARILVRINDKIVDTLYTGHDGIFNLHLPAAAGDDLSFVATHPEYSANMNSFTCTGQAFITCNIGVSMPAIVSFNNYLFSHLQYDVYLFGESQKSPAWRKVRWKAGNLIWGGSFRGLHLGATAGLEMGGKSFGGEAKIYGYIWGPLQSCSVYANYRRISPATELKEIACLGFGGQASFFSLELNSYFLEDQFLMCITPKLGLDAGNLGLFYGFHLPVYNNYQQPFLRHSVTLKWSLWFDLFGEMIYRDRLAEWKNPFPSTAKKPL